MKIMPNFETVILSEHAEEYIDKAITNLKNGSPNILAIPQTKKTTSWKSFRIVQTDFLFHNSFLPDVYFKYLPIHGERYTVIRFTMKKTVLAIIGVYLFVCAAMEISLLISVLLGKIPLTLVSFIPVLLLIFISMLSILCQKVYSRKLLIYIAQTTSIEISDKLRFCLMWRDL